MVTTRRSPAIRDRRIVGIEKAAKYAGVSRWTVRAWIIEKRLPVIKYPGKGGGELHKIDLDDLDKFIENRRAVG